MNQKPLLYVLIITLVVALLGFVYLNFSSQSTPSVTTNGGGKVAAKISLPPEPKSPRVFPTLTQIGTQSGATVPKVANMVRVSISANGFDPNEVTISPGDLVTWTNKVSSAHIVKGQSWGSGSLAPGQSFTQEFDVAGTFSYADEINPTLTGTVVIK